MTMQRLKNEDVEIANEDVEIASEGAEIFVELNLENKKDESESILSEFHDVESKQQVQTSKYNKLRCSKSNIFI